MGRSETTHIGVVALLEDSINHRVAAEVIQVVDQYAAMALAVGDRQLIEEEPEFVALGEVKDCVLVVVLLFGRGELVLPPCPRSAFLTPVVIIVPADVVPRRDVDFHFVR